MGAGAKREPPRRAPGGARLGGRTLLVLLLAISPAHADWVPRARVSAPRQARLANGMGVVLEVHPRGGLVAVAMAYDVGAKDAAPGRRGLPHLAEHLAHRATRHLSAWAPMDTLTSVGGHVNAFTTDQHTVFLSLVPTRHLPRVLWVESERMAFLAEAITERAVEEERQILLREWQARRGDAVGGRILELEAQAIFPPGHAEHSPWGPPRELGSVTAGDVQSFVHQWYRPDNATLVIVGDFQPQRAMQEVKRFFGDVRKPESARKTVRAPAIEFTGSAIVTAVAPVAHALSVFTYALPAMADARDAELELLGALLEERLYGELVIRRQWAESAQALLRRFGDTKLFSIAVELVPGARHSAVETAVDAVLDEVKSRSFPLEHLKQGEVVETLSEYQKLVERAEQLGFDPNRDSLQVELGRLTRPSSQEIRGLASVVFPRERRLVLRVNRALKSARGGTIYQVEGRLGARPRP